MLDYKQLRSSGGRLIGGSRTFYDLDGFDRIYCLLPCAPGA